MMGCFDDAGREVDVVYVLIRRRESNEDSGKVMSVQFAAMDTGALDTDAGVEDLEVGKVGLDSVVTFKWCQFDGGVNEAIVQIDRVS
jgi:hypothetical protein